MKFLSDLTGDNRVLFWLLSLAAILVVLLVLVLLVRALLGSRLRGGARSRQPRLGVVDAYDLDRHRQLVIVRRDNVEHLLMIGGPNDLLIEAPSFAPRLRAIQATCDPAAIPQRRSMWTIRRRNRRPFRPRRPPRWLPLRR